MVADRLKEPISSVVDFRIPGIDYLADYSGKVVLQRGSNSFDFQPDDQRLPSMAGIPVCLPFPGFSLQLDPTQSPRARVGWNGGDPSKPELRLWEAPGLSQLTMSASQSATLSAPSVTLGPGPLTQPLILGTSYLTAETAWYTILAAILAACGVACEAAGADPVLNAVAPVASTSFKTMGAQLAGLASGLADWTPAAQQSLSTVSRST